MTAAVILAGGKGTRLASVSEGRPKPLVPVAGVPVVVRQIELLVRYGIDEVFLTTGYRADVLEAELGDGSRWGIALHHVREDTPLGTAGGVAALADRLHEDFLVLYGDVLVHIDLQRLLDFHRESGAHATVVVHPNDHPYDSDLVDLDEQGRVRGFHPKPRPDDGPDLPNMVSAALYVLSPSALSHIETGVKQDFVRHIFPRMMAQGAPLFAYHTTEYLKDMGTPDRLARVEGDILSGMVEAMHAEHTRPTLFLDRDGVINEEIDGVRSPEQLKLLPGVGEAIRRANKAGWLVAVVTNQPIIAKGFIDESDLHAVHLRLQTVLGRAGAWVDGIVHCPHHPQRGFEGERPELKIECACRKPAPGMLEQHASRLAVDRGRAVLVGDSWRDMAAAHAFGAEAIGVRTGHGLRDQAPDAHAITGRPDVLVDDLSQAVSLLLDPDPQVDALAQTLQQRVAQAEASAPALVLIGGTSHSGKSLTAFRLRRALAGRGVQALTVKMDDWLVPASQRKADSTVTERYPLADIDAAVRALAEGERVTAPGYDPQTRETTAVPVEYDGAGAAVIIVEGVLALALQPESKALRVHLSPPSEDDRVARIRRSYAARGLTEAETAALLQQRQEEHDTVATLGERAELRFVPRPLAAP
ncbi:MAG: HAD-IIIA family hydrolase [Nannocystaceae bacterium]